MVKTPSKAFCDDTIMCVKAGEWIFFTYTCFTNQRVLSTLQQNQMYMPSTPFQCFIYSSSCNQSPLLSPCVLLDVRTLGGAPPSSWSLFVVLKQRLASVVPERIVPPLPAVPSPITFNLLSCAADVPRTPRLETCSFSEGVRNGLVLKAGAVWILRGVPSSSLRWSSASGPHLPSLTGNSVRIRFLFIWERSFPNYTFTRVGSSLLCSVVRLWS